jgi:two-component system OmpR family sensor kinase
MTIKRRLVASVGALSLVVFALASLVTAVSLRNRLVARIDQQVHSFNVRGLQRGLNGIPIPALIEAGSQPDSPFSRFIEERDVAIMFFGGGQTFVLPAGSSEEPKPLPEVDVAEISGPQGPYTVNAVDGTIEYRIAIHEVPGGYLVVAVSLEETTASVRSLIRVLMLVSTAAVTVVVAGTALIVGRGLKPIDEMIQTAERVGEGTLSERVPVTDADTEVGQLATAVNSMLGRVEEAVAVREESESRLRRFASDASHELRTPLTSILGYAELYRHGGSAEEAIEQSFGRIESEGGRMARMLEQLLQLTRLDQSVESQRDPLDIRPMVEDLVSDARVVEPERPITLLTPNEPALVAAHPDQIRQIVGNLLANVRSHTAPLDGVEIAIALQEDSVLISVRDEGPGMSQENTANAFDRFFRANPSGPGSGLGLSIVDAIAKDHNGTASITGSSGTTVTVELPRA